MANKSKSIGAICSKALICLTLLAIAPFSLADSPNGFWRIMHVGSDQVASIARLYLKNGELHGQLIKVFDPEGNEIGQDVRCGECAEPYTDKPWLGMEFMQGFKGNGDTHYQGQILHVPDGKLYNVNIRLIDDGQRAAVKGNRGVFTRTIYWQRCDSVEACMPKK